MQTVPHRVNGTIPTVHQSYWLDYCSSLVDSVTGA